MLKENNFNRMCSFYVSNIHLSTMILPYLSEKIEKGETLATFLEKNIQEEMKLLLSKTNIKEELKNTIKSINWNKTNNIKYNEIEKYLNNFKKSKKVNILVVGTDKYIEQVNINIQKYLEKVDISLDIIDAYEVSDNRQDIKDLLEKYEYMINTSGKHLIKDVFEMNVEPMSKKII